MTDEDEAALRAWVESELAWHLDIHQGACDAQCGTSDNLRRVQGMLAEVDRLRAALQSLELTIAELRGDGVVLP